ncbi:MAG TPA: hypothetical protein VJ771_05135 [Candidatus Nitrosotalea sp.]|nr:hypothetical protein [Candidatus Nitrosotalea sp.]
MLYHETISMKFMKKRSQIMVLLLLTLFFVSPYVKPVQGDTGISIINLRVQPSTIKVGDTFVINATLVNNSPNTINVFNTCSMPFSVDLDHHTASNLLRVCNWMSPRVILNSGESISGSTLNSTLAYKAVEAGVANVTVTFSYNVFNQTSKDFDSDFVHISKSIQFTISNQSSAVIKSPLEQFRSGTAAKDVVCNDGFQLVIKTSDGSPACLNASTAQKLVERGWAQLINATNTDHSYPATLDHS